MNKKNLLSLLIAAAIAAGLLAGCGGNNPPRGSPEARAGRSHGKRDAGTWTNRR